MVPAATAANDFARDVRGSWSPIGFTEDRTAERLPATRAAAGGQCGHYHQPLEKIGMKFCSGDCYSR